MIAILVGLVLPGVAVAIYFALALFMILFRALQRHRVRAHRSRDDGTGDDDPGKLA